MTRVSRLRTVRLTERVPADCRLTAADVAFLLAGHRRHLEVVPAGRRGWFRLTPRGRVGVIVAPSCRLVIAPKIPLRNILYLLDPLLPPPATADRTTPAVDDAVLEVLAARLAGLLQERAAAGLHRGYAERAAAGPFLHGVLDVPAQLRQADARRDRLHCRYEDFTLDVPCNQAPRATAEALLRSGLLGEPTRAVLRRALRGFEDVAAVPLTPELFEGIALDRLTESYRPLLELCRLLADSLAPGDAAGETPAPAFLLDLERVFERYVTRGLVEAFAGGPAVVSVQQRHVVSPPAPGQPDLPMRPDVTLDRAGGPVVVVDAKWKRPPRTALPTADVYQVLAYAAALGAGRAVLVYPGRRDRLWCYPLAQAAVDLEVRTLRVTGTPGANGRSLRRLARALRPTP
jgi:5-methylcytosine-specific restriction enzyme subunit McrC